MIEGIDKRIVIVGGGPIGLYTSYLIKKLNPNILVTVLEEHDEIGIPVSCSGLISISGFNKTKLKNYININDYIINKVRGADIFGPHLVTLKVESRDYKAYVIDRERFDKKIRDLALSQEVDIQYHQKLISIEDTYLKVKDLRTEIVSDLRFDFLIGADGPNSIVRDSILTKKLEPEFIHSYQILVEGEFGTEGVSIYLGDFAKGLFGWVIPESPYRAKIGIGTSIGTKNPKEQFDKFIDRNKIKFDNILSTTSGLIPVAKPLDVYARHNRLVVGDAACFVKATTGGGVNFGLLSAEAAAKAINERIKEFKDLETNYKHHLSKYISELKTHYKIRKYIDSKTNIELENLLIKLKKIGIEKFLEKKGDMDFPSYFMPRLLTNPNFITLAPEIIKYLRS